MEIPCKGDKIYTKDGRELVVFRVYVGSFIHIYAKDKHKNEYYKFDDSDMGVNIFQKGERE